MTKERVIEEFRSAAKSALGHVPLFALRPLCARLIVSLMHRHPELFDRLGEHRDKGFLIDPVDLPFVLLLHPGAARPQLVPHDRAAPPSFDAAIIGPLEKLIDLINGEEDGDALFFSRELRIEGDTEAVLALRNAIDNVEIDLLCEIEELLGPLTSPARAARQTIHQGARDMSHLFAGLKTVLSEKFWHKSIDRTRSPHALHMTEATKRHGEGS